MECGVAYAGTEISIGDEFLRLRQFSSSVASFASFLRTRSFSKVAQGIPPKGVAYAGTEISIGDEFLRLRQETHQCVAKLLCDEIVLM